MTFKGVSTLKRFHSDAAGRLAAAGRLTTAGRLAAASGLTATGWLATASWLAAVVAAATCGTTGLLGLVMAADPLHQGAVTVLMTAAAVTAGRLAATGWLAATGGLSSTDRLATAGRLAATGGFATTGRLAAISMSPVMVTKKTSFGEGAETQQKSG